MSENARRCVGAVLGAGVGTLVFWFFLRQGTHIPAAVGALPALGVSWAARTKSLAWGIAMMVLAVALLLLAEFLVAPFAADPSLGYFLAHVGDLPRNTLISLPVVAVLGFWFGRGRVRQRPQPA